MILYFYKTPIYIIIFTPIPEPIHTAIPEKCIIKSIANALWFIKMEELHKYLNHCQGNNKTNNNCIQAKIVNYKN